MGMRFRKSIKAGPVRVTFSKSGVSTSIGVKGARVTKRADGRTQTTVGIPGTGVYYTEDTTKKRSNTTQAQIQPQEPAETPPAMPIQQPQSEDSITGASYGGNPTEKNGCLVACIIGIVAFFLVALLATCGSGG